MEDLVDYRRSRDENAGILRLDPCKHYPKNGVRLNCPFPPGGGPLVVNPPQQQAVCSEYTDEQPKRKQYGWRIRKKIILARFGALDQYDEVKMTCPDIAEKYGVNKHTVQSMVRAHKKNRAGFVSAIIC